MINYTPSMSFLGTALLTTGAGKVSYILGNVTSKYGRRRHAGSIHGLSVPETKFLTSLLRD
jgi:hypothetical protein